jgi:hypothetical protein
MKNLNSSNVYRDYGEISVEVMRELEKTQNVILPKAYVDFISKHNGVRLEVNSFEYYDPNIGNKNSDSIAFNPAEKIQKSIDLLQYDEEPDLDIKYRFEDGLIPFGDNGGGDLICFDYRKDRTTDNPPIVIWNHDMGFEHRVIFIANNFEEFINMLHELKEK